MVVIWGVTGAGFAEAEDWVVDRYAAMSKALNATGRPIVFAIVGWGVGDPWKGWGTQVCPPQLQYIPPRLEPALLLAPSSWLETLR